MTAVGWVLLMIGAMVVHFRHGQFELMVLNFAYLALAAFIAWGRFDPAPFTG